MSIKISIKNSLNQKSVKNHVFFTNKNFKINELSKLPISKYSSFINQSLSSSELADKNFLSLDINCLLYTSPSPRDRLLSRMPSSA